MPKPVRTLPGTVEVTPDPVTVGQEVAVAGKDIPDDGSHSVWLRWNSPFGTLFTGAPLFHDGTFLTTLKIHVAGEYQLDVMEGFGGPKAKRLATDTFDAVSA
mgnify:CR=1 FL=1